jgi:hypothetical protein
MHQRECFVFVSWQCCIGLSPFRLDDCPYPGRPSIHRTRQKQQQPDEFELFVVSCTTRLMTFHKQRKVYLSANHHTVDPPPRLRLCQRINCGNRNRRKGPTNNSSGCVFVSSLGWRKISPVRVSVCFFGTAFAENDSSGLLLFSLSLKRRVPNRLNNLSAAITAPDAPYCNLLDYYLLATTKG